MSMACSLPDLKDIYMRVLFYSCHNFQYSETVYSINHTSGPKGKCTIDRDEHAFSAVERCLLGSCYN